MGKRGGYRITPAWQKAARDRLAELGMDGKTLAAKVKCRQSTIWDILNNPEQRSSHLVPKIHKALGWPPPPEDVPHGTAKVRSVEADEGGDLLDQLPEALRKAKLVELRVLVEALLKSPAND